MIVAAAIVMIALSSLFLFAYGVNLLYLSWRALRLPPPAPPAADPPAGAVVVQLPIYNERYVAERVIEAAARLDWPRDLLEIQVLDDSNDDTPAIAARAVERWRRSGVRIEHIRREHRVGYKAGALAHGMARSAAPFVAVFDADFVPPRDFLRRTMPALADERVGFVQGRWGHLNEDFSLFTYLQSLMTDFHFLVEQSVRRRAGYLMNFTGSAGVWRRTAIEDAGGWSAATLTEDLDLSYRAQLRGWRPAYVEDVVVPQELPVSANAYRAQQSRWATGSFQCAYRLLGPVMRADLRAAAKFEAAMHLLGYMAPVAMLLQILCYPVLLWARASDQQVPGIGIPFVASALSLAPAVGMAVAQRRRGRDWWPQWWALVGWSVLGAGTSVTVVASLWRSLRSGGEFERTPKYRIERFGEDWRSKAYFKTADLGAAVELVLGLLGGVLVWEAWRFGQALLVVYTALFCAGFLYLSLTSYVQSLRQLRYEAIAPRMRALLPRLQAPGLVALAALLLLVVAQLLPDPFEDSYQHWLIAANLATTGRLQDPLFQMQDTWLPAYHLLAALVLRMTGIWQLGALKAVNVLLGAVTLAVVHRLAGERRRGLIAVALLALNPIFVLTVTSAVAEPLLVLCLVSAVAAANVRRMPLAALLACLACLTGTKAWLWLGCAVGLLAVETAVRRWSSGRQRSHGFPWRLGWAVPALVLALVLQSTFGFASHSVARAAVEVGSATARGSVPASPLMRAAEFLGYFALASAPVAALAPLGLAQALRGRAGSRRGIWLLGSASLLYLGLVTLLVFAGIYSGSHRYYYPALPGLALLAALAVDRLRVPLGLVPLGAAVVVAIGFVPVLSGLAADNRGLRAAGSAAATLPGGLLTDSPAAAYFSHKSPADIYGSRELPADRGSAVTWLEGRGISGLVLEDIDYYRARAVLPDLVSGRSAPPFVPVGAASDYSVPGGKRVEVYELGRPQVEVAAGVQLSTDTGAWPARGKTAPLAKGPVLVRDGRDLAGGGLGFGVPLARFADGWWFPGPGSALTVNGDGTGWTRTFDLDLREVDDDRGHFLRFEPGASHGQVRVTYRLRPDGLLVEVAPPRLAAGFQQLVIANEESAAFDDYADGSAIRQGNAIGSMSPVSGAWARYRSASAGLEWAVPAPPPGGRYFAEHELRAGGIDFSGLDWVFDAGLDRGVDYVVTIRRAR